MAAIQGGRRIRSMANFVERPVDAANRANHGVISIPIDTTVEIFVADNTDQVAGDSMKCLEVNRLFSIALEVPKIQRAAFTLGIVMNVLTGVRMSIRDAVAGFGIGINFVPLPSRAIESFVLWPQDVPNLPRAMVQFGIAVLMLFKSVTDANYDRYIAQHTQALCAITSYAPEEGEGVNIFHSSREAENYRRAFGNIHQVKVHVLRAILAQVGAGNKIGRVCEYLTRIMAWHEMSAIIFINHTLLVTNSPVLRQPMVASEVVALRRALKKIMEQTQPQYFRILAPIEEHRLVERNNFPLLIQVARELLKLSPASAQNLPTNAVVADLVSIHNRFFMTTQPPNIGSHLRFVTSYSEMDEMETQDNKLRMGIARARSRLVKGKQPSGSMSRTET